MGERTVVDCNHDTWIRSQVVRHVDVHAYICRVITEIGDLLETATALDSMSGDGVEEGGEEGSDDKEDVS